MPTYRATYWVATYRGSPTKAYLAPAHAVGPQYRQIEFEAESIVAARDAVARLILPDDPRPVRYLDHLAEVVPAAAESDP